jgi:predicted enzyme related to lactoylglutathione lyase
MTTLATTFELVPEHDIRNLHGAPSWFELTTSQPAEAEAFLGETFGWTFRSMQLGGGDYRVIQVAGHDVGGIKQPMPGDSNVPRWDTYMTVSNVDDVAAKAAAAGGQVVVPPMQLGDVGRLTAVAHPLAGQILAFEYAQPFS